MTKRSVGTELPPLEIPITATLIVAGAIATRDFVKVHHDRDAANAAGAPDIFMNILTTNGLVGRYVTDWAGPTAELKGIRIRLGASCFPGDTMTVTGRVEKIADDGLMVVVIAGTNSRGVHVSGEVELYPDRRKAVAA